jgi:hypothetical protein
LAEVTKELLTLIVDKLEDSGIFLTVTEGFYGYLDGWFRYWCHSLLAFDSLLGRTAHLDLNLDIAFAFAFAFTLHLFVAAAI